MPDWKALVAERIDASSPRNASHHVDTQTIEELAAHLQDRYDELRAAAVADDDAVARTLREWADDEWRHAPRHQPPHPARPPLVAEMSSSGSVLTDLWRDFRHGARLLGRDASFSITVILTLAFGIAATTVSFTVINTILLAPLPVAGADRLVLISGRDTADPENANAQLPLSYADLQDLRRRNDALESLAGHAGPYGVTLTGDAPPQRIFLELVTANYFDTLGITPSVGRFFFDSEDAVPGAHPVLVLSHTAWRTRFAARADIAGQTVEINRMRFTIVGVAPPGFKGLDAVFGPDVWVPSMMAAQVVPSERRDVLHDRAALAFGAAGRLRPNAGLDQARANLEAIAAQLTREFPVVNRGRSVAVRPFSRASLAGLSPQLAVLTSMAILAIPALVLLIACSNAANLLLARATTRGREFAVRLALGAERSRIARQLLTENAVLGVMSGALGLAAAWMGAQFLWSFRPAEYAQNLIDVSLDRNVVLFGMAVSFVTTLLFGMAPALTASRTNLITAMNEAARTAGHTKRTVRWRHTLLVGQVALSLMALATAGLFVQSLERASAIDPGFERERLGIVLLNPGQTGYDRPRAEQLYRTVRERLSEVPGVTSVSWATNLPLFARPSRKLATAGAMTFEHQAAPLTVVNTVDAGYFTTTRIAVTRGREFTELDGRASEPVAIINEALAERYWGDRNPIGDHVSFAGDARRRIVGVVRTVNYGKIGEPAQPCLYLPLSQNFTDAVVLYVGTAMDPAPLLPTIQREIQRIDARLDVADARTIRKVLDQALFGQTMGGALSGVFGLLALSLASLGMYGVMAYTVNLRQREMGVRLALGAEPRKVVRLVLRDGLRLVSIGIAVGLSGAVAIATVLSRLLHGISPVEPLSLLGGTALLAGVAFIACYLPARRVSRLEPVSVLRAN